ncbi:MAG TPA: type I DNA topoisomerase [Ruminococcaceae bacterium]|nr:type I DNA topoisomerase [Oscillospiraceae bacterium]
MSNLVIVESPAKAKTIKKYLGPNYEVTASMGHVRDLQKSKMSVDIENGFEPLYVEMTDKEDVIKKLRQEAAGSDKVYLATDPDREGEAISWHLSQMLALNDQEANRVTFNEITKSGVKQGMEHPRKIDADLVDAQQARRILDRIVGYKISPFLWKKVKRGLSAGRVQSVALRIIVDREQEIRAFVPEEYWSIDAALSPDGKKSFKAALHGKAGGKKLAIKDEEQAAAILKELAGAEYIVGKVKKGVRNKQPAPPFITSTLQQEASRKLGFTGQRTMKVAQELYEGVEVKGTGTTGLITYMRTDSLRISEEARGEGNKYITGRYGEKYLPEKPRYYKSRAGSQDAHEAIRPTSPSLDPESLKDSLSPDQFKLYRLIWQRFISSLMAACVQDTVQADIEANGYIFKASGYTVRFDGFTVLYEEGRDDEGEDTGALPPLTQGDPLKLMELKPNQHFTQPPARYTEASLIRALEENGIGRPSTYAPIISTLLARDYIIREKKALLPTPLGEVITELMKDYFKEVVDIAFSANMEKSLDDVEAGRVNWKKMLSDFYGGFEQTLKNAEEQMDGTRIKVPDIETDVVCDICGRNMVIKSGRFGKFLACPGYPECKNTKPIVKETPGECPLCGGKILQKKSKNGHKYFGCENAPSCQFMTWDEPVKDRCPKCDRTLFKKRGMQYCAAEGCGYEAKIERKTRKKADTAAKPKSGAAKSKKAAASKTDEAEA